MGAIDLLKQLRKLQELINLDKLPAVLHALQTTFDGQPSFDSPGGIEARILEYVHLASTVAAATKTTADDTLADTLKQIAANPELLALAATVVRWFADLGAGEPERLPAVVKADISWTLFAEALELLNQLWTLYCEWRNG